MSNVYSQEAQQQINTAENKLGDAIANLKSQIKSNDEPEVEIIQENEPDVEITIDEPAKKEPRRSEFVPTEDPKVQERINDLYRQVKGSDSRNQMIIEHNRQLEARLAEYAEKVNQIERNTKSANSTKVEEEIGSAIKTAWEEGDFERAGEDWSWRSGRNIGRIYCCAAGISALTNIRRISSATQQQA